MIVVTDIFAGFLVLPICPIFLPSFPFSCLFFFLSPSLYCALSRICFSYLFSFTPLLIWKFCPLFICVLSNLSVYLTEFKVTGVLQSPIQHKGLRFQSCHSIVYISYQGLISILIFLCPPIGHYFYCFNMAVLLLSKIFHMFIISFAYCSFLDVIPFLLDHFPSSTNSSVMNFC